MATSEVQKWLEGTSFQMVAVKVDDRVVITTVEGNGELNPVQELANQLALVLEHPVLVNVRTLPAQIGTSSNP